MVGMGSRNSKRKKREGKYFLLCYMFWGKDTKLDMFRVKKTWEDAQGEQRDMSKCPESKPDEHLFKKGNHLFCCYCFVFCFFVFDRVLLYNPGWS
jgi:hypothetical protein